MPAKKCFECPDHATQVVEIKTNAGMVALDLCAFHADGHRRAAAWSRVVDELREAEDVGDFTRVEELDLEQMEMLAGDSDSVLSSVILLC